MQRYREEKDVAQCRRNCWVLDTVPRSTVSADLRAGLESGTKMKCSKDTMWNREVSARALHLEIQ